MQRRVMVLHLGSQLLQVAVQAVLPQQYLLLVVTVLAEGFLTARAHSLVPTARLPASWHHHASVLIIQARLLVVANATAQVAVRCALAIAAPILHHDQAQVVVDPLLVAIVRALAVVQGA